jgi:hypothetical protein
MAVIPREELSRNREEFIVVTNFLQLPGWKAVLELRVRIIPKEMVRALSCVGIAN